MQGKDSKNKKKTDGRENWKHPKNTSALIKFKSDKPQVISKIKMAIAS